jgi:hypothetical protein
MGLLQKFHLVLNYYKGNTNRLEDMLSMFPTFKITYLGSLMHMDPFTHDAYKEECTEDEDFKEAFQRLHGQIHIEEGDDKDDYHFYNRLLYKINKVCIPKGK